MNHISLMRERIAFMKHQAEEFRRLAETADDVTLQARFADLGQRCDDIAGDVVHPGG